ncbi:MAG: BON domain-containing protein [Phenylobacterium sp.]|nr:MAG: BON domain-containing protein [Phenylobacterium sp.]
MVPLPHEWGRQKRNSHRPPELSRQGELRPKFNTTEDPPMADRWTEERERRERARRSESYGGGDRGFEGGEDRSFIGDDGAGYGARRSGPDRDRVFGERETGMGYGGEDDRAGQRYAGGGARSPRGEGGRPGWQDPNYGGVSPAMEQGEYDAERTAKRYDREHPIPGRGGRGGAPEGGRYYGDGGRERIYREEYGQGGVEYGDVPRGYDAGYRGGPQGGGRGYDRGAFTGGRTASGGTGGYDYERGYGDGGRTRRPDERGDRFEQAGRDAGDFVRRAGERVAGWFGAGEAAEHERARDHRGLGPKGYKRADERIDEEVHERLTDDAWLDATHVTVTVSGGEVTLSGTVVNRESKHRAERIAEDISGVNHVQNNLRVDHGNPLTRAPRGFGDSVLDAQTRGETGSGASIDSGAPGTAHGAAKNGAADGDAGKLK